MRFAIAASALVAVASAGQYQSPPPSSSPSVSAPASQVWTTSTVYSTTEVTITSCASTVTNCPAHPESQTETQVVTSWVAVSTTVCPVTESSSSPGAPVQSSSWPASPVKSSSTPGAPVQSSTWVPPPSSKPYPPSSSPAGGVIPSTCATVTETCTVTVTAPYKPSYPAGTGSSAPYKSGTG